MYTIWRKGVGVNALATYAFKPIRLFHMVYSTDTVTNNAIYFYEHLINLTNAPKMVWLVKRKNYSIKNIGLIR